MGRASGEGFGPACGWAQISDGRNDFDIRAQYQEERNHGKQRSNRIDTHFIKHSVPIGQWSSGDVTEEAVDLVWSTEEQWGQLACLCCRDWNSHTQAPADDCRPILWVVSRGRPRGCTWTHRAQASPPGGAPRGSRSKEEARLMPQLSEETLLLSWVQRFTRILGRVTDT